MAKEDLAHLISREHVDREIRSRSKTVLIRRCTVKRKLEWKAFTFCEAIFGRLSKKSKAWIFLHVVKKRTTCGKQSHKDAVQK